MDGRWIYRVSLSQAPGCPWCLTTCLHGVNKVYKEDAGDGAAIGNIFCFGEQITERDATTTCRRETDTGVTNTDEPPGLAGVGVAAAVDGHRG